jgi:hypothetical protein
VTDSRIGEICPAGALAMPIKVLPIRVAGNRIAHFIVWFILEKAGSSIFLVGMKQSRTLLGLGI